MVFNYIILNEGIGFLVGFGRVTQYLSMFLRYVMESNVFFGMPYKRVLHVY